MEHSLPIPLLKHTRNALSSSKQQVTRVPFNTKATVVPSCVPNSNFAYKLIPLNHSV
jgi:hypothetical protein